MKEKRWRIALEQQEVTRLATLLTVVHQELPDYRQRLSNYWSEQAAREQVEADEHALHMIACLEALLPKFDELIQRNTQDGKNGQIRIALTAEELLELRAIYYCASHLPDQPDSLSWQDFVQVLTPLLAALDRSIFEQVAALVTPKAVSCSINDFKRGRAQSATADTSPADEEFDGLDWNT
ncbi:MAG: hypothetical protein AB1489_06430 [Acidobacteriota bacterium]